MTPPPLNVGFGTPFEAQIDFMRKKLRLPTERWDDIQRAAHDRAFIVAGAAKADLLADLQQAVLVNGEQGLGVREFQKAFKSIVAKHGWTGWTGEGSAEGEAWRARIIYQTNMATSYAAGRRRQMTDPEYLRLRPYWRYIHSDGVAHPRPHHLAWHGLTLAHDHPFWQTHFAPNGWGCQCRLTTVSRKEGEASARAGLGDPPDGWDAIDPKTGAQVGIDKGFDYAPGANVHASLRDLVNAKLLKLSPELGAALKAEADSVLGKVKAATVSTVVDKPRTWVDYTRVGRLITDTLPTVDSHETALAFHDALIDLMEREVGLTGVVAEVVGNGAGAKMVRTASKLYPDSWVKAANSFGKLEVKAKPPGSRGVAFTLEKDYPAVNLPGYGTVRDVRAGEGFIAVPTNSPKTAVHEYAHRLQSAIPGLDNLFQELHTARTAGQPLKQLRVIEPHRGYGAAELAREDHYVSPYQGREYSHSPAAPALEVMTMGLETVLGSRSMSHGNITGPLDALMKMYSADRSMIDFVVGLLLKYP